MLYISPKAKTIFVQAESAILQTSITGETEKPEYGGGLGDED